MPIDKMNFWEEDSCDHPPLTDEMIAEAETALQVKLPALFIELLRVQNGGPTKGFIHPMTVRTRWSEDHIPLSELYGIVTDRSVETIYNILDTAYMTKEWGLPEKQVLLSGDGHTWITLDYRNAEVPSVKWMDTESKEEVHIADSFEAFINGLQPEEYFDDDPE